MLLLVVSGRICCQYYLESPRGVSWNLYCSYYTSMIYQQYSGLFSHWCLLMTQNVYPPSLSDCYSIQEDLNSLTIWSQQVQLLFNQSKCMAVRFSVQRYSVPEHSCSVNGLQISGADIVRDIGVWLTKNLDWSVYLTHVKHKAYKMISLIIRNIFPNCSIEVKRSLYLWLVRS